jgi:hypothetical protein
MGEERGLHGGVSNRLYAELSWGARQQIVQNFRTPTTAALSAGGADGLGPQCAAPRPGTTNSGGAWCSIAALDAQAPSLQSVR